MRSLYLFDLSIRKKFLRSHKNTALIPSPLFICYVWSSPAYLWVTGHNWLTHWGWDKIDDTLQTTFSNAFSWMKIAIFLSEFHWNLFPRVQLTSHYLTQWWPSSQTHICITWSQWVNTLSDRGVTMWRPQQNGWQFADNNVKSTFMNENVYIKQNFIEVCFVPDATSKVQFG